MLFRSAAVVEEKECDWKVVATKGTPKAVNRERKTASHHRPAAAWTGPGPRSKAKPSWQMLETMTGYEKVSCAALKLLGSGGMLTRQAHRYGPQEEAASKHGVSQSSKKTAISASITSSVSA